MRQKAPGAPCPTDGAKLGQTVDSVHRLAYSARNPNKEWGMPRQSAVHVVGQVRLRQRGPQGVWHVRYQTPDGRVERSLKVTNLRVAQRKAQEISDLLEHGRYEDLKNRERTKDLTLQEFWDGDFRDNYADWSENTWSKHRSYHE